MPFFAWSETPRDLIPNPTLPAGMSRQAIVAGEMMICIHEAFPNLKCQPHQHAPAQLTIILQGKLRMVVGDEVKVIGPGELAYIPGGIAHSIESLNEYVRVMDVFSPVRQDIQARLKELHQIS